MVLGAIGVSSEVGLLVIRTRTGTAPRGMQGNLLWDRRCRFGKLPWRVAKVRVTVRATWGAWELVQQNLHSVAGGIDKMTEIM